MIYGPWVSVWKQRMAAYAKRHNVAIPKGFRPRTYRWGKPAQELARRVKTKAGIDNATGNLDGALRAILLHDMEAADNIQPPYIGIDVSNNNGFINWGAVPEERVKFVWAKVSQGTHFVDRYYDGKDGYNYDNAKKKGIAVGGYHFMQAGSPEYGRQQVDFFLEHLNWKKGDLLPVLDWENTEGSKVDVPSQKATLEAAVKRVYEKIGSYPIIYSGYYTLTDNQFSRLSIVRKCPLWIAAYGKNDGTRHPEAIPGIPKPWNSWAIHQYTDKGKLPGFSGYVDLNYSVVPLDALK